MSIHKEIDTNNSQEERRSKLLKWIYFIENVVILTMDNNNVSYVIHRNFYHFGILKPLIYEEILLHAYI